MIYQNLFTFNDVKNERIRQFKLDSLEINEEYENIIIPMLKISPKLVLGGSIGLGILGLLDFKYEHRRPDIDFSLSEKITEEETNLLKDFFQFDYSLWGSERDAIIAAIADVSPTFDEMRNIKFIKCDFFNPNDGDLIVGRLSSLTQHSTNLKIDIFKNHVLGPNDMLYIPYKDIVIPITHPHVILKAKVDYAYQNEYSSPKHLRDLEDVHKDYSLVSKKLNIIFNISNSYKRQIDKL